MTSRGRSQLNGGYTTTHTTQQQPPPPSTVIDDADAAAGAHTNSNNGGLGGMLNMYTPPRHHQQQYKGIMSSPPISQGGMSAHPSDLEFFEDLVSDPVLVLGVDISHLSRRYQFMICATGVFCFSLLYGYLQELISVQICNRQLGLFLAMVQFTGYTLLSYVLRTYVYETHGRKHDEAKAASASLMDLANGGTGIFVKPVVPMLMYLGLSLLRAVDLAMTNLAMQYINYPAKTLMKSSRVVFTMIFGVLITRKKYRLVDYFVVLCMVFGLAIFMHADATSSAVFQPAGVIMLTVSLICDGAISNMSETIMKTYGVGQDEFIFRMYSIALVAITAAAAAKGDLRLGLAWMMQPGTYDEMMEGSETATWTVWGKIMVMVLFSSMGFFGSSCSAAITKQFGALTMSITSTARKATTLFLSFFLFNNVCTMEHITGVIIFISALTAKSLRRTNDAKRDAAAEKKKRTPAVSRATSMHGMKRATDADSLDLEMQMLLQGDPSVNVSSTNSTPARIRSRDVSRSPGQLPYGTPARRHNSRKTKRQHSGGLSRLGDTSRTMVL